LSYKPGHLLINWDTGKVVGSGDKDEVREQLKKLIDASDDAFIIAEVKMLSAMRRIES
jgi:hypothetical protein